MTLRPEQAYDRRPGWHPERTRSRTSRARPRPDRTSREHAVESNEAGVGKSIAAKGQVSSAPPETRLGQANFNPLILSAAAGVSSS